jgi:glycosyltransferase involved in cell wall biosynthesis
MATFQPRRVLVLGIGPLPSDNTTKIHGSCQRTVQFVESLRQEGHHVFLVAMRITGLEEEIEGEIRHEEENLTYYSVDEVDFFRSDEYLQKRHDEFQPDCIIGVNVFPSTRACQIQTCVPIWADINGYSMGEAQTKAYREKDDMYVRHFWNQQKPALLRADKFSSASKLQKHILVGELGSVGRLNQYTMGYKFAHTIHNGRPGGDLALSEVAQKLTEFPDDAFLILWSGGYNLWCDVETMFMGLERAMQQCPNIRFVSTGGIIDGVDEESYPKLQRLVEDSQYKDRFHLKGWIASEEVPKYYSGCDIGINVDAFCYEAKYGARNRITDMMRVSMPILTTLGTEISSIVAQAGCGLSFPIGDADAMCSQIIYACSSSRRTERNGPQGTRLFPGTFHF